MVGQTTQDRINCRIKLKICNTIFLYSKEKQITMTSIKLLEIEPAYNQGQDIIIFNQKGYQQVKKDEIFQQTGSYMEV